MCEILIYSLTLLIYKNNVCSSPVSLFPSKKDLTISSAPTIMCGRRSIPLSQNISHFRIWLTKLFICQKPCTHGYKNLIMRQKIKCSVNDEKNKMIYKLLCNVWNMHVHYVYVCMTSSF